MIKKQLLRFTLSAIIIYLTGGTLTPVVAATQPSGGNGTHFCGVIDSQWDKRYSDQYPNRRYARSTTANLDVGEPRTVRMIYFLPNDRPYRADVAQGMKDEIRNVQTLYAEQMEAHGYGKVTFRVEADTQGEPMVHRVDGGYPDTHYLDDTIGTVLDEINLAFNLEANVYLIFIDNSINGIGLGRIGGVGSRQGKNGGFALVTGKLSFGGAEHELGHAFGLQHDFRDGAYIMSYGRGRHRLSACHAEFLSVHPYFNLNTPTEEGESPTIEFISPRTYPTGSQSVPVRLKISNSEGLHQVRLHGSDGLVACRGLTGEKDAVVNFDYDGAFRSEGFISLSSLATHSIYVEAVDTNGNVGYDSFGLTEISPHHIATFEGHTDSVNFVGFPRDGETLASGSRDGMVKLWDVETLQNIATLRLGSSAVAFSTDGKKVASGSYDGIIELWDVVSQREIATLKVHTEGIISMAFSSDKRTLAAGSHDGTVKLWDVETERDIATFRHTDGVNSVAFSPDGTTLASCSWDRTVKLWDVVTQQNIATLEGHTDSVNSVAFSSDDTTLASGTEAGTVELWDTSGLMGVRLEATAEIDLPDPNLRAAIAEAIGLPPSTPIFRGHLAGLTRLDARNANISDLTGLEGATNLRKLDLSPEYVEAENRSINSNSVSDISPLTGLTKLWFLNLRNNSVSDISAVAGLTNLTSLDLENNSVSDISAVAGLTNLTKLYLYNNSVSDISAVAGLTNLTYLYLWNNSVSDISAVAGLTNLRILDLRNNSISDISAVAGLTKLTSLDLENTSVSDISPLVANIGLGSGDTVYVQGNPLSYLSIHTHIPTLQSRGVTVQFNNRAHPALLKISGDNQKGAAFASLSQPFLVEAQDENGFALVGISVMFAVTRGDGTLGVTSTTTDANGRAQSTLILGPNLGANTVEVSAAGIESPATFYAIADSELPPMRADVNHDGLVNVLDLIVIASSLGQSGQHDGDVNGDRVVSILDLVLAAGVFEETAAAPSAQPQVPETLTAVEVHGWLTNARSLEPKDPIMKRGFAVLEQLLVSLTPKETELLANYPNPFNPETWIPYRLAEDAFMTLTIYDQTGRVVRTLEVGYRIASAYESRSKAIYWDGRNGLGEQVASGVYFYHLSAGDYSATRKMVILK